MNQEYSAGMTNARPCYSNMKCYGAYGKYKPIVPPTPATVQQMMFNYMRPHKIPHSLPKSEPTDHNCTSYRTLDGTCRKCWSK